MGFNSYFSVYFLPLLMSFPLVISEYRESLCNNASTYTEGSSYSTNLDRVIADLLRNTPHNSGFGTSSHGQYPHKVYGLLQCIANTSAEKCSDCSHEAYKSLREHCASHKGGLVLMDSCILRYDSSNFISTLELYYGFELPNLNNISSNLEAYESTTSSLLSNLSMKAYNNPASKRYAVGSAPFSSSDKVYGLVQCWRDISIQDCRLCLVKARQDAKRCCPTKDGGQVLLGSCTVRYEIYPFFESAESPFSDGSPPATDYAHLTVAHSMHSMNFHLDSAQSPFSDGSPPPTNSASPTVDHKKTPKKLPIILGLVGGILLVSVICLIATRKRVKSAIFRSPTTLVSSSEERRGQSSQSGILIQERYFVFSLEALVEATDNFNDNNKLGEGGFGVVYKGTTRDGTEIAVKKLSARSTQGKREFMNEVKLLANVQHRNLVKLLGCCAQGNERMLVYEYLRNKSLDSFLFDPEKRRELDWQKRYNIIIGVARGLLYLHEDSQMRIIHRDIKANNILLDDKLKPKIADFGLARLFPENETHIQTRVAGTHGYMAPEYVMRGQLSVKADVYSFGVLLLEIVSGRKNSDVNLPHKMINLLEWAWRLYNGGDVLNMVDSTVRETCPQEKASRSIHVGLLCVQADATVRPGISNVIIMISSNSVTLPNPTKPAFLSITERSGSKSRSKLNLEIEGYEKGTTSKTSGMITSSTSGIPSVNEMSVSQVEPR